VASATALTAALVLTGCSEARPSADAPGTTSLPSDGSDGGAAPVTPGDLAADPADPSAEESSGGSAATGMEGGGQELPESTEDGGLPGLSEDQPSSGADGDPLVSRPLPRSASASGRLVAGYPTAAMPTARHSRIDTSSVSSSDSRVQVALVATTDRTAATVLRFYRLHLAGLGFTERPTTAVGGSEAAAFRRGSDVATVTVTPTRTGTSYSVFGTLHAGS